MEINSFHEFADIIKKLSMFPGYPDASSSLVNQIIRSYASHLYNDAHSKLPEAAKGGTASIEKMLECTISDIHAGSLDDLASFHDPKSTNKRQALISACNAYALQLADTLMTDYKNNKRGLYASIRHLKSIYWADVYPFLSTVDFEFWSHYDRDKCINEAQKAFKYYYTLLKYVNALPYHEANIRCFLRLCFLDCNHYDCLPDTFPTSKTFRMPSKINQTRYPDIGYDCYKYKLSVDDKHYFYYCPEEYNSHRHIVALRLSSIRPAAVKTTDSSLILQSYTPTNIMSCIQKYKYLNIEYGINESIINRIESDDDSNPFKFFNLTPEQIDVAITPEDKSCLKSILMDENDVLFGFISDCIEYLNKLPRQEWRDFIEITIFQDRLHRSMSRSDKFTSKSGTINQYPKEIWRQMKNFFVEHVFAKSESESGF